MSSVDVLNLYSSSTKTLSAVLESRALIKRESPFLFFDKKRQWSWQEFHEWVSGVSQYLKAHNIHKGDRVLVVSHNSDATVALFFALSDIGAVFVPLNPELSDEDYRYLLKKTKAVGLFCAPQLIEKFKSLNEEIQLGLKISSLEEILNTPSSTQKLAHEGSETDTALILYTSGTTGFPKGAMHSQRNAVVAGEAFVERMLLVPEDRLLCILPFFHINALFYSLMGSALAGASLIVPEKFSASKFWDLAADLKATEVNIIAAIGKILSQRDRKEFRKDHQILKVYGAPVSKEIEAIFQKEFQIPTIIEGYGMTEIPGAINNRIGVKAKTGTMGVAALHPDHSKEFTKLKIVDENNQEVPIGEEGELLVKTPILMQGYFDDPQQTKEAFTQEGWFRTGDIVKQDIDGFYVFVARKKDIIRKRGENISGAEIDRIVEKCAGIAEAAAIGVPSDLGEEEILVAYVCQNKEAVTPAEVHKWCQANLAKMKIPRFYLEMEKLPHTPTARVAKHKIRSLINVQDAWDCLNPK